MKTRLINSDPDILGGTPVFTGTRVPIKNLTDSLEAGDSIDEFLDDFPSVSRAQVVEFLEEARAQLGAAVALPCASFSTSAYPDALGWN